MIISFILITLKFDSGVILWGEIRCWSLSRVKGLITSYVRFWSSCRSPMHRHKDVTLPHNADTSCTKNRPFCFWFGGWYIDIAPNSRSQSGKVDNTSIICRSHSWCGFEAKLIFVLKQTLGGMSSNPVKTSISSFFWAVPNPEAFLRGFHISLIKQWSTFYLLSFELLLQ